MTTILKETGISVMMTGTNSDREKEVSAHHFNTPLGEDSIKRLRSGDILYLSGTIYGARDEAHKRMISEIEAGGNLPLDLKNATIFYVGPSPTPPGKNSGSIGPTTAARMDGVTEPLLKHGLKAMIGKGRRSEELKSFCIRYRAVYLIAVGGIAAYLSSKVSSIEMVAYNDLGPEAIYKIQVRDFPLFVAYDIYGGDIFL